MEKISYLINEFRWENTADPIIELKGSEDELNIAIEKAANITPEIGFNIQVEKITVNEDDDVIDSEIVWESDVNKGEDIKGSIVIQWSWEKHVGYARNLIDIGIAGEFPFHKIEKEVDLFSGNEDYTYRPNFSVLIKASDIENLDKDELIEKINDELGNGWKWNYFKNNPNSSHIVETIEKIVCELK